MAAGSRILKIAGVNHRVPVDDDRRKYTLAELRVIYHAREAAKGDGSKDGCGNPAFSFKPGGVVELKSGGIQMTVLSVTKDFTDAPIARLLHSTYGSIEKQEIPEICLRAALPKARVRSVGEMDDNIPF